MSTATTTPVAPAVTPAPASGAVNPAETPSTPQATAAPASTPLSTAILSDRIRAQLTGEKPNPQNTPPATGEESAPAAPGASTPTEVPAPTPAPPAEEDETDDDPQGLSPQALAALSQVRKSRAAAKARAKELEAENATLKAQIAQGTQPKADPKAPDAPTVGSSTTHSQAARTALEEAEQAVAENEGMRDWAQTQASMLRRAIQSGGDTAPILTSLADQLKDHKITLSSDPEAVLTWLDNAHDRAKTMLEDARSEERALRQQARQESDTMLQSSQALADEWAPQMKDANTDQGRRAAMIRQTLPGIDRHPLGPRFIAAAVRGWEIINAEIQAKATSKGAATAAPNPPKPVLPAKPTARLPGGPSVVPARPEEAEESSSSLFAKMQKATSESERAELKTRWMKASLAGR